MRQHNLQLSDHPQEPGQPLLIAEIDELGIAIEHFCRLYLHIDSSADRQLPRLLRDVGGTLDTGGADPDEIQRIRSHLVHASLPQAAAFNRMSSVQQYVHEYLEPNSRKLNELLHLLLEQVVNPLTGDFSKKPPSEAAS